MRTILGQVISENSYFQLKIMLSLCNLFTLYANQPTIEKYN